MIHLLLKTAFATGVLLPAATVGNSTADAEPPAKEQPTLYDFTVKSIDGKDVKLGQYKGDVLLIVNVASK